MPGKSHLFWGQGDDTLGTQGLFDDTQPGPPLDFVIRTVHADSVAFVTPEPTAAPPPVIVTALPTALYLQEPGDSSAISVNDIHQGGIGDCFLLSSIGEIALWHPSAIMNMICANPDGTETVTLHLGADGLYPVYGTTSSAVPCTSIWGIPSGSNSAGEAEA